MKFNLGFYIIFLGLIDYLIILLIKKTHNKKIVNKILAFLNTISLPGIFIYAIVMGLYYKRIYGYFTFIPNDFAMAMFLTILTILAIPFEYHNCRDKDESWIST